MAVETASDTSTLTTPASSGDEVVVKLEGVTKTYQRERIAIRP